MGIGGGGCICGGGWGGNCGGSGPAGSSVMWGGMKETWMHIGFCASGGAIWGPIGGDCCGFAKPGVGETMGQQIMGVACWAGGGWNWGPMGGCGWN